jgi:hypothetical protein
MTENPKTLLAVIIHTTYGISGLTGELKYSLSNFLQQYYAEHFTISQFQNIENISAGQLLRDVDAISDELKILPHDDQVEVIAVIKLLQTMAEDIGEHIQSRKIGGIAQKLSGELGLNDVDVDNSARHLKRVLTDYRAKPTIKIAATIWPLALDYLLRWIALFYLNDKNLLLLANIIFIPAFIFLIVVFVGRRHRRINTALFNSYGGRNQFDVNYSFTTSQYTWLAFLLGSGVFISYLLPDQGTLIALLGLSVYYIAYVRIYRLGKLDENDLIHQLEAKNGFSTTLNADENDEAIVNLETRLNSYTVRLEAYVLESALFGALSFSGFLQIMATDLISFADLENFAAQVFNASRAFIHMNGSDFTQSLTALDNKVSLFCLISVESLVCSIFFLGVIASRLRFSDIADKVRASINLAKAYNEKEELLSEKSASELRIQTITQKIHEQLESANVILADVNPAMAYMRYFRNAGILMFLIILISSSLLISGVLGWTFLLLVAATLVYFNRRLLNVSFLAFSLNFRIVFIRRSYRFMVLAVLPICAGYVLRIFFQIEETDMLVSMGILVLTLYICLWLLLAAHVDEKFGDIESSRDVIRQNRWKRVKLFMAILIFMYGLGSVFKILHYAGADELLIVSISLLAVLIYFVGYYLSHVKWIGIFCGLGLNITSFGIMFKILHLEGGDEMLTIGIGFILILLAVIVFRRRLFHSLLIRFVVAAFLILMFLISNARRYLSVMYEHATHKIAMIDHATKENEIGVLEDDLRFDEGINLAEKYLETYGDSRGLTGTYRSLLANYQVYYYVASDRFKRSLSKDTLVMERGLVASRQMDKINALFDNEFVRAEWMSKTPELLVALGRKEEAIRWYDLMLASSLDEFWKEEMRVSRDKILSSMTVTSK